MKRRTFLTSMAVLPVAGAMLELNDLKKWADESPSTPLMPVLFIGHGSPMNALADNNYTHTLNKLGADILAECKPTAILVVSAHWLTRGTWVQAAEKPEIIYDFGGFPDELYKVQYPVQGSPAMAEETAALLDNVSTTTDWGLDHGAWTVLKHIFPSADVPAFQISIDWGKPMSHHYELAGLLSKLREKGVLILGSGNIVHNLQMSFAKLGQNDPTPYDWAVEFDAWVKDHIDRGDYQPLLSYEKSGSMGMLSVPTPDHYIPMLYTLGLAKKQENVKQIYESVEYGGLSMRCFRVG